jgi:hypothetical protein
MIFKDSDDEPDISYYLFSSSIVSKDIIKYRIWKNIIPKLYMALDTISNLAYSYYIFINNYVSGES